MAQPAGCLEDATDVLRDDRSNGDSHSSTEYRANDSRDDAFEQKQPLDLASRRAQRAENSNFRSPVCYGNTKRVVDDEHSDQHGKQAGYRHCHRITLQQSFEMPASSRRRFDLETRSERGFQCRLALVHCDAILRPNLDAVETSSAAELLLRRIDIHDRQVSTERLRHAGRAHDAADREFLLSIDRDERKLAVDVQVVARSELSCNHKRVRL